SALAKAKVGDRITTTVTVDKAGGAVITGIVQSKEKAVTLKITGILCQACADRLHSSLAAVPGIKRAVVTANPAQAVVTYDPAKIGVDAIKDTIRKTKPIHEGTPFGVKD
ncbi:MAG: heavy-metal-associated domain-containing protein, partial [Armatimonadota bacterium]